MLQMVITGKLLKNLFIYCVNVLLSIMMIRNLGEG